VFIIGHLGGIPKRKVFPIGEDGGECDAMDKGQTQITGTINSSMMKGGNKQDSSSNVLIQVNNPAHSNDRVYSDEGISPTLDTIQGGRRQPFIKGETRIRRLTPIECARLQGFPDDWCVDLSDSQAYKCYGNAVTTNVITEIVKRLYDR